MKSKTVIYSPEHFFQVLRKLNSEPVNLPLEQQIPDMCFILFGMLLNKPKVVTNEQFLPFVVSEHAHNILNELKKDYIFIENVLNESDKLYATIANFLGYTKFYSFIIEN